MIDDLATAPPGQVVNLRERLAYPLPIAVIGHTMSLMINAGYETTVNVIDPAIFAMLTSPDQLDLVRSGQVAWEDVVEEPFAPSPPSSTCRCASP
ncbi:hypothetical protein AB0392_02885 [Nonomuraea angiospora]|uniref:hypothetical protein n=1 Tax=Nonomuraea angiospora TaxID=46172 RepID=UPI00344F80C4